MGLETAGGARARRQSRRNCGGNNNTSSTRRVNSTGEPRRGAILEIGRHRHRGRHQASLSAALAATDGQRRKANTAAESQARRIRRTGRGALTTSGVGSAVGSIRPITRGLRRRSIAHARNKPRSGDLYMSGRSRGGGGPGGWSLAAQATSRRSPRTWGGFRR